MNQAYDDFKCIDKAADAAAFDALKLEAKAAEIRAEMKPQEWWFDIEEELCYDPMYKLAMQQIICGNYELGGAEVKKLADAWLDNRAVELAAEALTGGDK